jgi:radical SAM superfamily enzyme YgiQ (UPF0313 family)/glycosyltransferase involved in cell wall biosynthesis
VNRNGLDHIPYGILYIGSHLKKAGFNVKLHHFSEFGIDSKVKEIAESNPLWVGLSVLSGLTTLYSAEFSRKLKAVSNTKIVWGGHHPSLTTEQTLSQDYVDIVAIGFGEDVSVELSQALTNSRDLNHVPGLGYKDNGELKYTSKRLFNKNIDRFTIDWHLLDMRHYVRELPDGKKYVAIFSSRGCPFNCAFCSTRMYSGTFWAGHSVAYILELIDSLEKVISPIGVVAFSDDNVMINKERGFEIILSLRDRGIRTDYINIRVDQLSDEVVKFFNDIGVISVFFGFESGVPRILELMNKRITREQILNTVKLLKDTNLGVVASGILGIPTESEEEVKENVSFALKIWELIPYGAVSLFRFMPLPGTDLTNLAAKNGFKIPGSPDEWKRIDPQGPFYEMPWLDWITRAKLRKLEMTQNITRDFLPKYQLTSIPSIKRKVFFQFWSGINKWRLKNQIYGGFDLQNAIKRSLEKNLLPWLRKTKKVIKITIRLLDVPLCVLFATIFSIPLIIKKILIKEKAGKSILFLSGGSSLEACYSKFGDFEFLFDYDGQVKTFNNTQLFWYPAPSTCLGLKLRENYEISQFNLNVLRRFFPALYQFTCFALIVFLSDKSAKAIRAFEPYHHGLMGWFLSKLLSLPFCVSVHADYEKSEALQGNVIPRSFGSIRVSRWIEKFVYKHANMVLPIRESMREHLLQAACSEDTIRIFPHGIDMDPFLGESDVDMRKFFKIPGGGKIVSSAGRIEKENYCDDLIDIAFKCIKKTENLYFIICGSGSQLARLQRSVKQAGLEKYIMFPGSLARKTIIELRRQSDINLCLMAGFSLIEACASGRPVISYDVEWHYELVKNGESGFLVPENDIDTVVEKIDYLLQNPERADELGNNARKLTFEKHSLEVTNKIKTEIYEELLSGYLR